MQMMTLSLLHTCVKALKEEGLCWHSDIYCTNIWFHHQWPTFLKVCRKYLCPFND